MNILEQLKQYTRIVADTGDFKSIVSFKPLDATTNPTLLYKAAQQEEYRSLVENAVNYARGMSKTSAEKLSLCIDKLAVNFGVEILKIIPGRVSTETDARYSFDTEMLVKHAKSFIRLYEDEGIGRDRILIKIASTWEGIRAAEELEEEGVHTNMTLLFNKIQAIACADAHVTLISPFVGRIFDWYKKSLGVEKIAPAEDPGVKSVTEIYNYFKKFGHKTEIMGASFRNTGQIIELAGCDLLTIAPELLAELESRKEEIVPKLTPEIAKQSDAVAMNPDEKEFRWYMNEDAMATEKLSEGIRRFNADQLLLKQYVAGKI